MKHWLIKSEPEEYSIDDFRKEKRTLWTRIRNYEARNNLQAMKPGDLCLFYHSNASPSGIAGVAKVTKLAIPDPEQFDRESDYFDPKATTNSPRWFAPELQFLEKFAVFVPVDCLRQIADLSQMVLLRRGTRLSVQSITEKEFSAISALGIAAEKRTKSK